MIKGKPPRLARIFVNQPLYFVTLCTRDRKRLLGTADVHEEFRAYCLRGVDRNVGVGRYVIMPEHIHLFVRGSTEFKLGIWIRGLKRALCERPQVWQPGFFDHVLRSDESYGEKWRYVRDNPVRAQLVSAAEQWPFAGEIVPIDRV